MSLSIFQAAQQRHPACYFTMLREGDRVRAAKMSPSSGWLGLSVFRLGTDDPSAGQALLAAAPARSLRSRAADAERWVADFQFTCQH